MASRCFAVRRRELLRLSDETPSRERELHFVPAESGAQLRAVGGPTGGPAQKWHVYIDVMFLE